MSRAKVEDQFRRDVAAYRDLVRNSSLEDQVTLALDITDRQLERIDTFDPHFAFVLRELRSRPERPDPAIRRLIRAAVDGVTTNGVEIIEDPLANDSQAPRWPSTLAEVDRVAGGFYGVTVVAGETGVGKSSLAMASACEAALAGWTVAYCNSELDAGTIRYYLRRWMPFAERRNAALANMRIVNVGPGVTLRSLALQLECAIESSIERFLIVLDSVNTIAELAQGGEGVETYFSELRNWLLWVMESRRRSGGLISALVISETNAKGETKGRKADYVADMVVHLHRGEMDGYVKVKVVKGRYSGRQDLGALYFDYRSGRFLGAVEASNEPI